MVWLGEATGGGIDCNPDTGGPLPPECDEAGLMNEEVVSCVYHAMQEGRAFHFQRSPNLNYEDLLNYWIRPGAPIHRIRETLACEAYEAELLDEVDFSECGALGEFAGGECIIDALNFIPPIAQCGSEIADGCTGGSTG